MATDIKLSKAQIKKLIQSGGFLGKLLSKLAGPLLKVALPLAKNVLELLGLTAAMSTIDGSIQKKIHGSGVKLIIEQEDMNDIMKIIEALKNSGILLKGVSKTIENETKEQRGGFLSVTWYFRSEFIREFINWWKRNEKSGRWDSTCRRRK